MTAPLTTAGRLIPGPAGGAFLGGRPVSPPRPATELDLFTHSLLEVVMAGRRRTNAARAGTDVPPIQKTIREQNRLARLQERLDTARTPGGRVWAAAEYVRSVFLHAEPAQAEQLADELVARMRAAGRDAMSTRPIPERRRTARRSEA